VSSVLVYIDVALLSLSLPGSVWLSLQAWRVWSSVRSTHSTRSEALHSSRPPLASARNGPALAMGV
jgi:hypothetical protein